MHWPSFRMLVLVHALAMDRWGAGWFRVLATDRWEGGHVGLMVEGFRAHVLAGAGWGCAGWALFWST